MSVKLNETTGYEIAGLTVDLMNKLRKGVISIEELKGFLTMKSTERSRIFGVSKKEHPKMKLLSSGIEIYELTKEFNPSKDFTENKKVKYWHGDNFKKYVLNPTKKVSNLPAMSFDKHKFTEIIYDKEIMEHFQISESKGLMTPEEILWVIIFLTSKQPKGEEGILQTNGYSTIIGYMLCGDGVVRAVFVRWHSSRSKWRCRCFDLGRWDAGSEMLSRNE